MIIGKVCKIIFKIFKWKILGEFSKVPKYIIAVAPHTSFYDFFIGILVRNIINEKINFIGKKELFGPLTGWFFRTLGGVPVDRNSKNNTVDSIVKIFNKRKKFILAIAPEGTRENVKKWKTGFYYIALKAKIPIMPVVFDYNNKNVVVHSLFYPSGNIEEDFKKLYKKFKGILTYKLEFN
jgi:1-acyl-sn-glycerol-3-phosphate acyltransferase